MNETQIRETMTAAHERLAPYREARKEVFRKVDIPAFFPGEPTGPLTAEDMSRIFNKWFTDSELEPDGRKTRHGD